MPKRDLDVDREILPMSIPHPIPYQGSKRRIAAEILMHFPDHVTRLVEPFAGSAAISLASAFHRRTRVFWLNDINTPLMALWSEIINRPEAICAAYEALWTAQLGKERKFYDDVRARFNQTHQPDLFLYLLCRCVKGAVRYNSQGEFNQGPDNRRKGALPTTITREVMMASLLLKQRTLLTSLTYQDVLRQTTPDDLVYMDPPYQGVCGNRDPRYIGGVGYEEFAHELSLLNSRGIPFIVSYDGRNDERIYGRSLPASLKLTHIDIFAGRSSQATLLGRELHTVETLYLSPALAVVHS